MKPSILIVSWRTGADYAGSEIFWSSYILEYSQKYRFGLFYPQPVRPLKILEDLEKAGTRLYLQKRLSPEEELYRPHPYHRAIGDAIRELQPHMVWNNLNSQLMHSFLADYPWPPEIARLIMVQAVAPHLPVEVRNLPAIHRFYETSDMCTFCTEQNLQDARKAVRTDMPNSSVIGNFVDTSRFTPPLDKIKNDHWQLSCVARYETKAKGQTLLLKALSSKDLIRLPWRLNLVGAGPDEEQLKQLVRNQKMEERVAFFETDDVEHLLHQTDLFVLPSNWEGLSFALLEAMSSGLPCVVSRVAGQDALVKAAGCGWSFEANDQHALIASLAQAFERRDKAAEMGLKGRTYVQGHFNKKNILGKMDMTVQYLIK